MGEPINKSKIATTMTILGTALGTVAAFVLGSKTGRKLTSGLAKDMRSFTKSTKKQINELHTQASKSIKGFTKHIKK